MPPETPSRPGLAQGPPAPRAGPGPRADVEAEQAVVEQAYAHLERMREKTQGLWSEMRGADPDLEWALARRARSLAPSPRPLCFGRTDARDGPTWYIGRRHVEDEKGGPLVVEWRAPVAVPFYRANWSQPLGLARRRQFVVDGREILFIGDDTFGATPDGERGQQGPRGAEALMVELERARTGEMLDIVATIQPEQDEVIRAPADGVLAVQGGPGSGKTAVGLHRAAFLLYTDDAMARANVLVIGPNRVFLRYISQVLPALGETAVVQTTLADLVPEAQPAVRVENPATERLKGDGRMADVLARALAQRRSPRAEDVEVHLGLRRLRVPGPAADQALESAAARRLPYAAGRDLLRDLLVRLLYENYVDVAGLPADGSALGRALRSAPGLKSALDRRWPSVSPLALVADLLSRPAALAAAAGGLFSGDEQQLLLRRRGRGWTVADGPLVDEAKDLVHGQSRTYGYAVVDEAQDLSPMELRMLGRRCPAGAMTLLGDMAQAIGPWGARSWEDLPAWLPASKGLRAVELRHGYRSTSQVLEYASRLLPEAAPEVRPTAAVRRGRTSPSVRRAPSGALVQELVAEAASLADQYTTVAIIVPRKLVADVLAAARAALTSVGEAAADGLGHRVSVVEAQSAKGLEFDAVVVGEPEEVIAEKPQRDVGLRLLYVALTRPTQHLSVLYSGVLPPVLATPGEGR